MRLVCFFIFSLLVLQSEGNEENCDHLGTLLYEDLGCKPIKDDNDKCPRQYTCNLETKNNTCTFKGRTIELHQSLENDYTYGACFVACHCSGTNHFVCAVLDCPEWLGHPVDFGCYRKYEVGECCSAGQICPTEGNPPAECIVDGTKMVEGERFSPENTCLDCVCKKGYEGRNTDPFCRRSICATQVSHGKDLQNYCAPFYRGNERRALCCPDQFICPSESDKVRPSNPKTDSTSDLKCKFGTKTFKLGEGIETEYEWYDGSVHKATCECILPPLLTCREIPASSVTTSTSSA